MKKLKFAFLFFPILVFLSDSLNAQDTLPLLKKSDYNQWQYLRQPNISSDGIWVSHVISPVDGNDTLFIRNISGDKQYNCPFGSNLVFSRDSKWAAVKIGFSKKEEEKLKEKKKPVHYKMKLINLLTEEEHLFKEVQSYSFSRNSGHLVMKTYADSKSKEKSSDLILKNLQSRAIINIGHVSEYLFNKKGDLLVYIINATGKLGNAVEMLNLDNYQLTILASDTSTFSKISFDKNGLALAFFQAFYDSSYTEPNYRVFAFQDISHPSYKHILTSPERNEIPDSFRIKDSYKPRWSDDLSTLFIGIDRWTQKPKKQASKEKANKEKKDKVKQPGVDVWHWKDDPIQPRQKKTYSTDKNYIFLCSWQLKSNRFIRLTFPERKNARLTGDQKHVYLWDKTPYKPQFRLAYADHYIMNVGTGAQKLIMKNYIETFRPSPGGKYILYFKDNHWWVYDISKDKHINLTEKLEVPFQNTRDDSPRDIKPPFGNGGWFKDDSRVLLYDEYDVWAVDPVKNSAKRLTNGRKDQNIYRVRRLDYEENYLEPKKPLYFTVFGDKSKKSGFARIVPKGQIENLMIQDRRDTYLRKAQNADRFIYTSESYIQSPNIFYVSGSFRDPVRLTQTNPWQKNYAWGKAELISFKNSWGKELQGVLHYPANYVPERKYPMLVYIYEIRSNSLHNYIVPSPKSFYNITNYLQQGYFVFQPDIVYKINHPGESAVACVVPAVKKVFETGMIDPKKVGIMGHSWGAYQTTFIITQTHLFSAAVAGAPLTDMISMYNSIYWNSGSPDQQIFETSQGRLREPFWNLLPEYIDNSPLFQATNIQTPILVAFGDNDGAVDWHQGIEFYITMRRLKKPMIMLVYAGENHAVRKKENMLDYTRKINEFFDTYLLGKPPKPWIKKGVSYLDKKKTLEKDLKK